MTAYQNILICLTTFATTLLADCISCETNEDCELPCPLDTEAICVTIPYVDIQCCECRRDSLDVDVDVDASNWCRSCSTDNDCGSGCRCETLGSAFGIDVKECRGSCCTNPDIDLAESPWCTSCSVNDDCETGCECVTLGNAFGIEVKECRGTCCTNPDIDFAETPWCTSCSIDNDCGSGCECETLGSAFGIEVKECRGSCCINPDFAHQSSGYEMKNEIEITAVATLRVSESGVDGTVTVDENGNVFINLNLGDFDNKDSCDSASYYIYTKYEYDLVSTNSDKCTDDIIGDMYNPFNTQSCSEYNGNGDKYFDCSIGDLSGRFGAAWINGATSVSINGNISEDNDDKEGGFCGSRLTPEALYKRSVVFKCNDEKENILFCAPFEINMNGGTGNCKELGEICEGTGDCCDSECFGFPGKDKKCCREIGELCETREDCCDSECVDIGGNGRKECYLE